MFCPTCKDEFRSGFTRCERCGVDLVEDLNAVPQPKRPAEPAPAFPIRMLDYCGFFTLDDARHARDVLRDKTIRAEILIREPPEIHWDEPPKEEFWLRVEAARLKEAQGLIEAMEAEAEASGDFNCSECGAVVAGHANACPGCGARFDE